MDGWTDGGEMVSCTLNCRWRECFGRIAGLDSPLDCMCFLRQKVLLCGRSEVDFRTIIP
jgi:hypothetical protein